MSDALRHAKIDEARTKRAIMTGIGRSRLRGNRAHALLSEY
jgi:hypothetical protein